MEKTFSVVKLSLALASFGPFIFLGNKAEAVTLKFQTEYSFQEDWLGIQEKPEDSLLNQTAINSLFELTPVAEEKTEATVAAENKENQANILAALSDEALTSMSQVDIFDYVLNSLGNLRLDGFEGNVPTANLPVLPQVNAGNVYQGIYDFNITRVAQTLQWQFAFIQPVLGTAGVPGLPRPDLPNYLSGSRAKGINGLSDFGELSFTFDLPQQPEENLPVQLYTRYRQDITYAYILEPFGDLNIEVKLDMMPKEKLATNTNSYY